ncbi:hypothetical protein KSD_63930 [Ktedonobacter sp. SOSP1-85]|uniref:hypothetical protein n=1 Tax=Ktedonobacter sp. SOSP1-85 TaxID=2778367 RepID=UPI0019157550|nr:hypothetical protein [Ktedonobacter sp. SOSP1-85]GHO78622.1 hypothetical protein KSD_63930 [Ktedonobacter sp. SOSP1-85]
MLLSDVENACRLDLFDPAGASQRWSNADLDRAIDKAVERYTQYYPNIAMVDMQTQPFQRTYPYPASWNPAYPVLWLERILYPLQVYGSAFASPTAGPGLSLTSGTNLGLGVYKYAVSLLTQGGETTPGPLVQITTTSSYQAVNLASIPLGPLAQVLPAVGTNTVIGRNIYRTLVGGSTLYLLATLADNTTTSYLDTASDASLANMPQPPLVNTSGIMLWPPMERAFAEYSNLYDSSTALAAGGNLGSMGAVGSGQGATGTSTPTFTLKLDNSELPKDNTLTMRVFYATRHQLDSQGSTIPEIHRDIIVLGACAYALEAYQTPTNDNFAFQDGSVRDHLDDTAIPGAWLRASQNKMTQFQQRLEVIKRQRDYASSAIAQWGQVQRYWWRI